MHRAVKDILEGLIFNCQCGVSRTYLDLLKHLDECDKKSGMKVSMQIDQSAYLKQNE